MKKLALLAIALPALALAQGITNTRHDMSAGSSATVRASTQTQTCIFCHTPHKSAQQALIWNHALVTAVRGWNAQTTIGGTILPADISASSKVCLSCHDGTVGLGDVNNTGNGTAGTIAMTGGVSAGYLVGNGTSPNTMLNNHPVSIPYAAGTYNGVTSTVTTGGTFDYQAATTTSCADSTYCTAAPTNGVRIRLYGTVAGAIGIECGSCHEVHNKYGGSYFLRAPAAGSALCLACHEK